MQKKQQHVIQTKENNCACSKLSGRSEFKLFGIYQCCYNSQGYDISVLRYCMRDLNRFMKGYLNICYLNF